MHTFQLAAGYFLITQAFSNEAEVLQTRDFPGPSFHISFSMYGSKQILNFHSFSRIPIHIKENSKARKLKLQGIPEFRPTISIFSPVPRLEYLKYSRSVICSNLLDCSIVSMCVCFVPFWEQERMLAFPAHFSRK